MVSQRHTGSRIGRIYQLEVGWRGEDWTTGTRSGSVRVNLEALFKVSSSSV